MADAAPMDVADPAPAAAGGEDAAALAAKRKADKEKKAAEKERARDKSEDGIEYVDLEDYKPGGKFSDQPAPPPELEDVKEPAPAVATFEAAPASGGVELESSLWTELL